MNSWRSCILRSKIRRKSACSRMTWGVKINNRLVLRVVVLVELNKKPRTGMSPKMGTLSLEVTNSSFINPPMTTVC